MSVGVEWKGQSVFVIKVWNKIKINNVKIHVKISYMY